MDMADLKKRVAAAGQEQVLRFVDQLGPAGLDKLTTQVAEFDLNHLNELAKTYVLNKPPVHIPADLKPVDAYPRQPDAARRDLYRSAEQRGHELLRGGHVAAFLVAGGQGTRLGYDGPKGEFPVTPIRQKSLFQVFAEQLLAHGKEAGRPIPWYVMTSDANDAATRAFFAKHQYFGLTKEDVFFFMQGLMPAFSLDGKLLLGEKDSLALSPDGHGGSLRALDKSGALADMRRRGVEHLAYIQVDNPLVHLIDPLFLGLHDLTGSEMSSKTIKKANAMEKVGNFVIGDGKLQVIEYSDLPESLAVQTNPDGSLRFNWASIGIHALRIAFVERLNHGGKLRLPWHRAEKKVPFVNDKGESLKPEKPNAIKLEQFVFDAIPLAANAIVYTAERGEEFSPVKNAQGVDSPETCRRDQIRRAGRWLAAAGVEVPLKDGTPDATLEISPLYAATETQLIQRGAGRRQIKAGESVYLG